VAEKSGEKKKREKEKRMQEDAAKNLKRASLNTPQ